jgi:hypothetical protein
VVIELDTLRALHEHGHRLSVFCRPCCRHVFVDLPALIADDQGGRKVVGLWVSCDTCGYRSELSIIWDPHRQAIDDVLRTNAIATSPESVSSALGV